MLQAREAPQTVVGLIAFSSLVTVFGDCSMEALVLQGDVLEVGSRERTSVHHAAVITANVVGCSSGSRRRNV